MPSLRHAPAAALGLVAVAALAVGGVALARSSGSGGHAVLVSSESGSVSPGATITVTGSGNVQGTPDEVSFDIGIQTTAASATAALRENDAKVAQLEASLAHHGVLASGMQTSSLDVWDNTNSSGAVTGFTVSDSLQVQMKGIDAAGPAIDAAADVAGNGIQLSDISFSISNESRLLAKARAAAMLNARTKAGEDAAGAGLALGPVVKVVDLGTSSPPPIYPGVFAEAASAPLKLEAGRQPVSVQVQVVYKLRS